MESIKRIESAILKGTAEKEKTLKNLEILKEQTALFTRKNETRTNEVKFNLANTQARPLVDFVTDCQNMAIKDVTNRLRITPLPDSVAQTKPQHYSPRKSKSAKFEKTETRMLRSYLEKNDDFVQEETFLKEMVGKYGPKILKSYPELWNERIQRIERLRAETNLNIKESENEMKTFLLAEREKKIQELNLDETELLEKQIKQLQIESDKNKAKSKALIEEMIEDRSMQDDLCNLMILTAEKEILQSSKLPILDSPVPVDMHAQFIDLKIKKKKLQDLIKKKIERLSRFSGRSDEYIEMLQETKPKTETSSLSTENDIKRWETSLLDLKTNLSKVPADPKDKYFDLTSSTKTFEFAGEIIADNEFNDICNLESFNVQLNRLELGINDLESQKTKISKRIKKQTREVKQEFESVREIDLEKVVQDIQSYCKLDNKNLNEESIKNNDAMFQKCLSITP